jgi:hypothetical protein
VTATITPTSGVDVLAAVGTIAQVNSGGNGMSGVFGACSTDSTCRSSASTVAYSVFAMLVAALLALAQF